MDQTVLLEATNRFLHTGDFDPLVREWSGKNILDRIAHGSNDLRTAIVDELRRREIAVTLPKAVSPIGDDLVAFTRAKLEPMVRGFFTRKEAEPVLGLLEKSVAFLMPENMDLHIRQADLHTAWVITNIYLRSIGAEQLDNGVRPRKKCSAAIWNCSSASCSQKRKPMPALRGRLAYRETFNPTCNKL
jgi:hypothetical protein